MENPKLAGAYSPLKSLDVDTPLEDVARRMLEESQSAFLVRDNGVVLGIVTKEDLLRVMVKLLSEGKQTGDSSKSSSLEWKLKSLQMPLGSIIDELSSSGI